MLDAGCYRPQEKEFFIHEVHEEDTKRKIDCFAFLRDTLCGFVEKTIS
jgi:hypothetical protein